MSPAPEAEDASPDALGATDPTSPGVARALDAAEALLWIGLLVFGAMVALAVLEEDARQRVPASASVGTTGVLEAEDLPVLGKSSAFGFGLQSTLSFRAGNWSKDGQMFGYRTRQGDWIDLALPPQLPGRYKLEIFLTQAADYGIVAVSLNGRSLEKTVDLWTAYGVLPTGAVDFGSIELTGKDDRLRFQVIGTNPRSRAPFFQFGIDGVRLTPE